MVHIHNGLLLSTSLITLYLEDCFNCQKISTLIGADIPVGFPGATVVKNPPTNAGDSRDIGSIPGSGRSLGVGNSNPLQDFCLENSMERGSWPATLQQRGVTKC